MIAHHPALYGTLNSNLSICLRLTEVGWLPLWVLGVWIKKYHIKENVFSKASLIRDYFLCNDCDFIQSLIVNIYSFCQILLSKASYKKDGIQFKRRAKRRRIKCFTQKTQTWTPDSPGIWIQNLDHWATSTLFSNRTFLLYFSLNPGSLIHTFSMLLL